MTRLTLSLPLFGILAMLAAPSIQAQPRPQAPVGPETSGQAANSSGSKGENFSANKTPAQLFQSDCTGAGCHKSPAGLAKGGGLGLTGFLREHYTNSRESAAALANYLSGAAGSAPPERPGRGEPATPRQPRNAARPPAAGEEAKPTEEGQGPLTPARRRPANAPAATAATPPAGDNPPDIARPEPGAKPEPAAKPTPAAAQRNQRGRPQPHQQTAAPPAPEPAAAPPPPPPAPPPLAHDIFD